MPSPARRLVRLGGFLACLFAAWPVSGLSQEGHPLTGTWSGDWGPTPTERHHLTLVMEWNGANVTGIINPGPEAAEIGSVFLDVTDWTVRIQATAEDASGSALPVAAEGRLEDIESHHRTIAGRWRQGDIEGDFRLTRD